MPAAPDSSGLPILRALRRLGSSAHGRDIWARTAVKVPAGPSRMPGTTPLLECNSAREAQQLASTYQRIIKEIRKQIS